MSLGNYQQNLNQIYRPTIQGQPREKNGMLPTYLPIKTREIPFYASFLRIRKKASYTIEAAVVLPLFISLMVFGMFIFRLLQVQAGVQQSIDAASRTMAVTLGTMANYGESDKDVDSSEIEPTITGEISEAGLLVATIGMAGYEIVEHEVPIEFIDGGAAGFDFMDTSVEGNYIDIQVNYRLSFPIGLLGNYTFDINQRARNRKWVGYDKAENTVDAQYVYITEKGEAYHRNYRCTYLNPSVKSLPEKELKGVRNKSGGIYYECHRCKGKKSSGLIYVTDYGTAYHNDVNCSEIKHNIKKVLYEEVRYTMRPCSKCAGEH